MSVLTVVCESHARDAVCRLFTQAGARGWTLHAVEGMGGQGERPGDIAEYANIRMETILGREAALQLLEELHQRLFDRFAMVAWISQVEVVRAQKFAGPASG